MKDVTSNPCPKLVKYQVISEVISEVNTDYKQIKQTVKEWEKRQQRMEGKVSQLDEGHGNNILILDWKRKRMIRVFDTLGVMLKVLRQ